MRRNEKNKAAVFCLGLILFSVFLFAVFWCVERILTDENPFSYTDEKTDTITWNDQVYTPNKNIETILLMGIDSTIAEGENRENSRQADFLALVVMDKKKESFCLLHINRDTMAEISQIDAFGSVIRNYQAQISLAHTYGHTDVARCQNTVVAVENLLYGMPIDYYISITMDAIPIINDSIGGVTVTLLDDFTHLDKSFQMGSSVQLTGEYALAYIRERGALEDNSNIHRMERQRQYIHSFLEQYTESDSKQEDTLETLMKMNQYMVSDCTIDTLSMMVERMHTYSYNGIETLAGTADVVNGYVEYHLDETSARETVLRLFYITK